MEYHKSRGIGIFAVIVIIAVIGIGGYGAVKISQKNTAEVEVADKSEEVKKEVKGKLLDLQTTLNSNLAVQAKIDATVTAVADIKSIITDASREIDTKTKAEFRALSSKLDKIEADVKAQKTTVADDIHTVIDSINLSINGDTMMEVDTDHEDDAMMEASDDGDAMMESDSNESGVEVDVNASGNVEVN